MLIQVIKLEIYNIIYYVVISTTLTFSHQNDTKVDLT